MRHHPLNKLIITGVTSGIGRELAVQYARRGCELVLLSRNEEALTTLRDELRAVNPNVHSLQCDVADYDQMRAAIEFSQRTLGTIDCAILNAGIGSPEWMHAFRSAGLQSVFAVNVFGIAHALEFLIPIMRTQGHGVIVGVSSMSDVRGFGGSGSYTASKAAATTLLESARVQLKPLGIDVITVRPGFVHSNMAAKNEFYMPFMMDTDRAARIIIRGIDRRKRTIQFPLPIVVASEIIRVLPNWIFEPLMRRARKDRG